MFGYNKGWHTDAVPLYASSIVSLESCCLVARVLRRDAEVFTFQTSWNRLAIVLATHIVVFSLKVLVYFGEESALCSIVSVASGSFPVFREVLVGAYLLHRCYIILPTCVVDEIKLLVSELVVPLTLDLVECRCTDSCDSSTGAQFVEGFCCLAVATQLHECLSFGEEYLCIANLDTVNGVVGDFEVFSIVITLVYTFTIYWSVEWRTIGICETILGIGEFCEVSLCQTLVVREFCIPVVVEVIVRHLGVVIGETASVLTILEWECP